MTQVGELSAATDELAAMVRELEELVSCESPPGSVPHLNACADLLTARGDAVLGRRARRVVRDGLPHLAWTVPDQEVLLLGHFDTVWPAGTITDWPFEMTDGTAVGPGVCDMKSGLVQMFTALAGLPDPSRVGVLLTSDEESGSISSRALIEAEARRSGAVLVLESSTADGDLKIARKGGSAYQVQIHGRASHAGAAPHLGVNATVEAANLVLALQALPRTGGTTITPTVLTAGTTSNTVPASANLSIDVRAWSRVELDRVDRMIRALVPALDEARLSVEGGVSRYPLTPELALPLLEVAQVVAREIGMAPPAGSHAPGASDGNFTAALGIPTLDGLGGVGGHAHAREEYVEAWLMPQRAALLGALVERLVAAPFRSLRPIRG